MQKHKGIDAVKTIENVVLPIQEEINLNGICVFPFYYVEVDSQYYCGWNKLELIKRLEYMGIIEPCYLENHYEIQ